MSFREFEVMDFNHDGWLDIVVHPNDFDTLFRVNPTPTNQYGTGIKLQNCIWQNNKGVFSKLTNQIQIDNIYPSFMKGFLINGDLRFFGFEMNPGNPPNFNKFILHDITIHFCNNLIKPSFSSNKFSFCSGDSLKLTVSNLNKGDTLKWFYGTNSDLSNVTSKTFTDSTKLFVTRTDSLGCVISSDTVNLVKYATPSAPVLSRDTANNLVASINGITWYKDGTAITDTTQKIKPTTGGSFTAKTTQNGCASALSTPYYYLVTDIINLSADEFIKLAPNPFSNQLNFDFFVKGYQRLNMDVYDLATGNKVASKQNLTPGMPIYLGQLSAGMYVIKVTSNDLKISYQFKIIKII
jgi:hypothetical protein